jgi:hypothetical protein
MRERDPLGALSLVLRSVGALRNTRVRFMLPATFAGAGLLVATAEASPARLLPGPVYLARADDVPTPS